MYRGAMYRKSKYGQNDAAWDERGAKQPLEAQVLHFLGGATYEVAISGKGVSVVQEQALSPRSQGE